MKYEKQCSTQTPKSRAGLIQYGRGSCLELAQRNCDKTETGNTLINTQMYVKLFNQRTKFAIFT
jgi:hypothetical protein